MPYDVYGELWDPKDEGFPVCGFFWMWDVRAVGCRGYGMLRIWNVWDVGCLGCTMWDVGLQNALALVLGVQFIYFILKKRFCLIPNQ